MVGREGFCFALLFLLINQVISTLSYTENTHKENFVFVYLNLHADFFLPYQPFPIPCHLFCQQTTVGDSFGQPVCGLLSSVWANFFSSVGTCWPLPVWMITKGHKDPLSLPPPFFSPFDLFFFLVCPFPLVRFASNQSDDVCSRWYLFHDESQSFDFIHRVV